MGGFHIHNLKPREKCLLYGAAALTDSELLAILLRTGTKNQTAVEVSDALFVQFGTLRNVLNANYEALTNIKGIKLAKGMTLIVLAEIMQRVLAPNKGEVLCFDDNEDIYRWLNIRLGILHQEQFLVVFMTQHNILITYKVLFVGTMNRAVIHPREVLKEALLLSASKIVLVHNHPNGSLRPSAADLEATFAIIEAAKYMGVAVVDHIIVNDTGYVSLYYLNPDLFSE